MTVVYIYDSAFTECNMLINRKVENDADLIFLHYFELASLYNEVGILRYEYFQDQDYVWIFEK